MDHMFMDIWVKGKKGKEKLEKVIVDTGTTYTFFGGRVVKKNRSGTYTNRKIEFGDGKKGFGKSLWSCN